MVSVQDPAFEACDTVADLPTLTGFFLAMLIKRKDIIRYNSTALFLTFLNRSLLSENQPNISVLVLTVMLLRFGMTCLLTFPLLLH